MESSAREAKATVRRDMRAVLESFTPEQVQERSADACAILLNQTAWKRAAAVLLYAPTAGELDVWQIGAAALAQDKDVALPRYDSQKHCYEARLIRRLPMDIRVGRYGIREPGDHCERMALNRLDLILVPGLAFDLHGRRLGRGKGYYDQMLAEVSGLKCGAAFDEQIVDRVPFEPHDVELNCILTPRRWLSCLRPALE